MFPRRAVKRALNVPSNAPSNAPSTLPRLALDAPSNARSMLPQTLSRRALKRALKRTFKHALNISNAFPRRALKRALKPLRCIPLTCLQTHPQRPHKIKDKYLVFPCSFASKRNLGIPLLVILGCITTPLAPPRPLCRASSHPSTRRCMPLHALSRALPRVVTRPSTRHRTPFHVSSCAPACMMGV